ncbi:MAG: hypothetical protein ACI4S2_17565 [Lachnospiraceae bacterium]
MRKKKSRKIKIVISGLILLFLLLLSLFVKTCMQYYWTDKLVKAIQSENEKEVNQLVEKDFLGYKYDVNKVPFQPFPLNLFRECEMDLPLVYACQTTNYNIIYSLVKAGADVNGTVDGHFTPLETVIESIGDTNNWGEVDEIVKLFIEHGVNIDYITYYNESMYELTASILPYDENGHLSKEREKCILNMYNLISSSGKKEKKYIKESFRAAVEVDNHLLINHLLDQDETLINIVDKENQTLLFDVCTEASLNDWKKGYLETANILVERGIDLNCRNKKGEMAYEYAKRLGLEDASELIRMHMEQ